MKARSVTLLAFLWRFIGWIWSILIVGVIVGVLGSVVYTYLSTGSITFANPRTLSVILFLQSHLYLTALILLLILVLTLGSYLAQRSQQKVLQSASEHSPSIPSRQQRQRLLAKVQSFWISNVLEQSLHGSALIALGLHEQQNAIANPWHFVLQSSDQSPQPQPPGTRITQVYDDAGGELLILGEPGSGKTTLLLELARDLLERSQRDEMHPIPVVFNLSSWAQKEQPILDWLAEELEDKYQVPDGFSRSWVENDQILPLLDGFDEVAEDKQRGKCIDALTIFRQEHGLLPTVVCSRSEEYLAQTKRLILRSAVMVQPLTDNQIDEYLTSAGEQLAALRIVLHDDPALRELAVTPLMLSVLTLAYEGLSVEDIILEGSAETKRKRVFESYVDRMLQRRGFESHYKPPQTVHWLSCLAYHMRINGKTEFSYSADSRIWIPPTEHHRYDTLRRFWPHAGLYFGLLLWLFFSFGFRLVTIIVAIVILIPLLISGGMLWMWTGMYYLYGLDYRTDPKPKPYYLSYSYRIESVVGLSTELLIGFVSALIGGFVLELVYRHAPILVFVLIVVAELIVWLIIWIVSINFVMKIMYEVLLRLRLWHAGYTPLMNHRRFLDYAAERILLRKIGHYYIFVHILLRDYFASLDTDPVLAT